MGTASLLDNGSLGNGYLSDDSGLGTSTNSGLTVAHSHHVSAPPRPFSPTQCRSPFLTPNLQPPQKKLDRVHHLSHQKNWCLFVEINLSTSNQQPPKILENLHDSSFKKKTHPRPCGSPSRSRAPPFPYRNDSLRELSGWMTHTIVDAQREGCVETPPTVKCSKLSGHASSSKKGFGVVTYNQSSELL